MKKITVLVLLAVISQFGCAVFSPFVRMKEPGEEEQLGLAGSFSDQGVSSLLWAESWTNKYGPGIKLASFCCRRPTN